MALTAENELALKNAGLVDFFKQNRPYYKGLAKESYQYANKFVTAAGMIVRVDDVAQPLILALHVDSKLDKYLAAKKLTQKYWYDRFADLILDSTWKELP